MAITTDRRVLLIATVAGALALAWLASASGLLDGLERRSIDARYALRGNHDPDPRIVVVAVDQRTIAELDERPPIARHHYADALDALVEAGADVVAIDVEFIGRTDPAEDEALVEAIERHGPVVLATHDGRSGPVPVPAGRTDVDGAVLASTAVAVDPDAVLRRIIHQPVATKTLAVVTAEVLTGEQSDPADYPDNHAWIDWAGMPGTYPTVSMIDVLGGRVEPDRIAGKVVLVGITDPTARDVFVTPMSSTPMAGVEVHAQALATVLDDLPLQDGPGWLSALVVVLLVALPVALTGRVAALPLLGICAGALVAHLVVAQLAFGAGLIVEVVVPALALALVAAGVSVLDSLTDKRKRAELEATLADLPTDVDPVFFISYRRDQSSWPAQALRDGLGARFGDAEVFMDLESIDAGQDFGDRIERAIARCSAALVIIGAYWLEARHPDGTRRIDDPHDWVRREVEAALADPAVTVVPVLVDGAEMPPAASLPPSLAGLAARNGVSLTAARWNEELDALMESLRKGRLRDALSRAAPSA